MTKRSFNIGFSKSILLIFFLQSIMGCVGFKPSATKGPAKSYETFYLGNSTTQYFIKPVEFSCDDAGSIFMDVTFWHNQRYTDTATVNISFVSKLPANEIEFIKFSKDKCSIQLYNLQLLYKEKNDKYVTTRFTSIAQMPELVSFFPPEHPNSIITVKDKYGIREYSPTKKTLKIFETIQEQIFSIL